MWFRCQKDEVANSFSSLESAYGSTEEVGEPGFWLKRGRICDSLVVAFKGFLWMLCFLGDRRVYQSLTLIGVVVGVPVR